MASSGAAGHVAGMEISLGKIAASASVSAECNRCVVVGRSKKACEPIGLGWNGLNGSKGGGKSRDKVLFSSSYSSSCSGVMRRGESVLNSVALAHAQGLQLGESLLMDIDSGDLEVESASLVQQCSDLDWKKLVNDLRLEAIHGLQSVGLRLSSRKALEKLMGSWIHDGMARGIESSLAVKGIDASEVWNFETAAAELRLVAKLQATKMLAEEVDSSFDWETDVEELHHRIFLQGGAELSVLKPEQRLWQAWARSQAHLSKASNQLAHDALGNAAVNGDEERLVTNPEVDNGGSCVESNPTDASKGKSLFTIGAAMATGLAVEGTWLLDAIAEEASPSALEAASRAPSWLVPAVLLFPPLSYFLFNVYRDKINPYASLTDWIFGIAAITIFSNLVMMAVWGVRLY